MKLILEILSYIGGLLLILGGLQLIPFLPSEVSGVIAGFAAVLAPVLLRLGDYLDNKKLDGSFSFKDLSIVKKIVEFFNKKD